MAPASGAFKRRPAHPLYISAMKLSPHAVLATWFGAGLMPWAPGTWGSLAAVLLALPIAHLSGRPGLAAAAALAFAAGCWAAGRYERETGKRDPGAVVIDEVAGQWLVLAAVPAGPWTWAGAFVLFRAADILKPWPARAAERRLPGGLAVMVDDIAAAAWAVVVLQGIAAMGLY